MKRVLMGMLLAALLSLTIACQKPPRPAAIGPIKFLSLKANLTHIYAYRETDGNGQRLYSDIDLTEIHDGGFPISDDETIETPSELYRLEVTADNADINYRALFGPIPGSDQEASAEIDGATGNFMLFGGWAWLAGDMPMGQTSRTVAAADGTRFILYVDPIASPPMDRVILRQDLGSHTLFVWPVDHFEDPAYERRLTLLDQYVENSETFGPVSTTMPVTTMDTDPIRRLVTHIAHIASTHNIQ